MRRRIITLACTIVCLSCGDQTNSEDQNLIISDQYHNEYYKKGTDLIYPYLRIRNTNPTITDSAKIKIDSGMVYLNAVTSINPKNYSAYWIKGKGYEVLDDHEKAYIELSKAFILNKENPDVAREYALQCLELGYGEEAVEVSTYAVSILPNDPGLLGNLATAYLINGDLNKAKQTIDSALIVLPSDNINAQLKEIIEETILGNRVRPTKFDEL